MAEEQVGTEMVEDAPATEMDAGNAAPDATELAAELERAREALKRANAEAAERRKKLDAFEEAERKRKEAEMSELEKVQAELQRERDARAAAEREATQTRVRAAVQVAAGQMHFHDPADVMAFLDADALTVDEDGKVLGVDDALKALVKARPYLVKTAPQTPPDGDKRGGGKAGADDRTLAGRYGVRVYDDN